MDFQAVMLKKLGEERTLYCEVHIFNLGGWGTNKTLTHATISKRTKTMQTKLLSIMAKAKAEKFKCTKKDDFMLKTLQACQVEKRKKQDSLKQANNDEQG